MTLEHDFQTIFFFFDSVLQERFTQDMQPHYIYSPREMTRWVRGICEALKPLETLPVEGLVRLWAHEALRLFQDRLVEEEERKWTEENVNTVALKHFPNIDSNAALKRPILFSNWLSKDYMPVDQEELRDFVKARLKVSLRWGHFERTRVRPFHSAVVQIWGVK